MTSAPTGPAAGPDGTGVEWPETDEAARLAAVRELGLLDSRQEERFDRITRLAQRLFGVRSALVTVLDEDRQWFKSRQGFPLQETPRAHAFCDTAIRARETLVVPDAQADDRFRANPLVTGEPQVRFYAGHPLEIPGGHRIGTLCILDDRPRELDEADRATLRDLADAVQKELLVDEEFDRAAQVQRALLPREAPRVDGYEVAGTCVPARSVGGDFYDWHAVRTGTAEGVGITIADVMGKGIAAAILMATVRAVLRVSAADDDQVRALATAAATLEEDLEETGTFVTLLHARLDPATGVVSCSDAGHGLTLLVRADGSSRRIATRGLPLGTLPGATWEPVRVPLAPGDTLVSVSDGYVDLHAGVLEGLEALETLTRSAASAQDVVDRVTAVTRGRRLPDDVTAVALRRAR